MAVFVVGSVVVYSFFLPQTAPKQITLAVLPMTEEEMFTPNSVGFTAALRDSLALSRDVALIDNISTFSVAFDRERVNEISSILALTHFVDGKIGVNDSGQINLVDFRVVNVQHPNWKEVKSDRIDFSRLVDQSSPIQTGLLELTLEIRKALYDNSELRGESREFDDEEYAGWLESKGESIQAILKQGSLDEQLLSYEHLSRNLYQTTGIAGDIDRERWGIENEFMSGDSVLEYKEKMWNHVGEFPNSPAVDSLAQLFVDLGASQTAERLWIRQARINAQSPEVALKIANIRWQEGNLNGAEQAMRIASQRSEHSQYVRCYEDLLANQQERETDSALIQCSQSLLGMKLPSRTYRDLAFHTNQPSRTIDADSLIGNYIGARPKFTMTTDPDWVEIQADLVTKGYRSAAELNLALESPDDVDQLFAPRRPD